MRENLILLIGIVIVLACLFPLWYSWPFIWQLFGFLVIICLSWGIKISLFKKLKSKKVVKHRPDSENK
ncbi:MAG: hypothetical protein ACK5NA_06495 [Enterococcus sp.]